MNWHQVFHDTGWFVAGYVWADMIRSAWAKLTVRRALKGGIHDDEG